jgi:hypothetical protein
MFFDNERMQKLMVTAFGHQCKDVLGLWQFAMQCVGLFVAIQDIHL